MRAFWSRLGVRVVLLEGLGDLVLGLMAAVWLQIPDSHTWEFALSVVFGLAIVLAFLWLQATVVREIRLGVRGTWLAAGILALWVVVWRVLVLLVDRMSVHVVERAGYWNSRLSAHQRATFTETRLEDWQNDAISTLLWFVLPGLLIPLLVETVSGGGLGTVGRVYRRWQVWLTVGVASVVGCWVAGKLTDWHPSVTVRGEIVSAAGRMGLLYCLLVGIGLVVVAVVAEMLSRESLVDAGAVKRVGG